MQPASTVTLNEALPARLPKGTAIDGYVVDGWLRDGGMAAIYRAHRASDATRVALKLQLPSTARISAICARFDREAEAMRRVASASNVVDLLGAGILDDGRRYFLMEWIEGDNLEELLDSLRNEDRRLALEDVCELGLDIAKGLAALHEHQLVHRDLKPANIMVDRATNHALVVKLVDFGIVADLSVEAQKPEDDPHADEAVMGTSAYMAPEQAEGHAPAPAMDVFALGVVLYEALTGNPVPPDGWKPETLPTIDTLRRHVPPELVALVHRCMNSDAQRRPRSAAEVTSELAAILQKLRAGGPRLVSSDDIPIRTGGTAITPRAQVPAQESSARTGGTEVVLTHEQVLSSMSGIAPVLPPPTRSTKPVLPSSEVEEEQSTRPTRWWLLLVILMPVVAGVSWWAGSTAGGEQVPGSETASHDPVRSSEPAKASPSPVDESPDVRLAPPEAVPGPSDAMGEAQPTVEPDAPSTKRENEGAAGPSEAAEPSNGIKSTRPPKGPDKATCEKHRGDVTEAKTRRDWPGVLKATSQAACWPGALKLERRRLRVEAYAEMGKYDRCVKEGGASSDTQIVARVKWCAKKLGT